MITPIRLVAAAALSAAALFLSGCVTQKSARAYRVERLPDFSVVQTSTKKDLTLTQLEGLREAVADYLRGEGYVNGGMYYVKVTFDGDANGVADEWAIVRIGTLPERAYTVVAAYPGPDDYFPYDYYRYGTYDRSGHFARYGYYYDPFDYYPGVGVGGYYGPTRPPQHRPDPDRPGDKPDGKPDRPRGTPTRWENRPRDNDGERNRHDRGDRNDYPPRSANPRDWARERNERRNDDSPRGPSGGSSYTPPPAPVSAPSQGFNPPPPSPMPPPRAEPTPTVRDENIRNNQQANEK